MTTPSRLVKYERRQAVRSALIYLILTALILFGVTRFGTQVLTSITVFLTSGKDNTQSISSLIAPPQIDTVSEITNQKSIAVQGSAPSGQTVRLTLNGQKQDIVANSQARWTILFPLNEGNNLLRAQVVDSQGNVSQEVSTSVTLDTALPTISSLLPDDGITKTGKKEQLLEISGQTEQDASVRVNDRIAVVNGQGQFRTQLPLSEGENIFTIVVTDRAGNTTQEVRRVTFLP